MRPKTLQGKVTAPSERGQVNFSGVAALLLEDAGIDWPSSLSFLDTVINTVGKKDCGSKELNAGSSFVITVKVHMHIKDKIIF